MVRAGRDDPHGHAILLVPPPEAVDDVEALPGVQIVHGSLPIGQEGLLGELDVDLAPPDVVLGPLLLDHALVHRGAACLLPAAYRQRPRGHYAAALLVREGLLVEHARWRIVVDLLDIKPEPVDLVHHLQGLVAVDRVRPRVALDLVLAPALDLRLAQVARQLRTEPVLLGDRCPVAPAQAPRRGAHLLRHPCTNEPPRPKSTAQRGRAAARHARQHRDCPLRACAAPSTLDLLT
mmetsp:Transcript_58544/g.166561  ORF Transcript_58544/g.166561 Transcript_58544/m.166561 type:complete len:235 (-) Transcript_58544:47-751(-)